MWGVRRSAWPVRRTLHRAERAARNSQGPASLPVAKIIVKLAMVPVGASLIACLGGGDRGSESSPAADMIHVAVPEIRVEGTLPADASAWHAAVAVHYFVDAFTAHPRWVVGEETAGLEGVISVKPPNDRAEVAVAGESGESLLGHGNVPLLLRDATDATAIANL